MEVFLFAVMLFAVGQRGYLFAGTEDFAEAVGPGKSHSQCNVLYRQGRMNQQMSGTGDAAAGNFTGHRGIQMLGESTFEGASGRG